MAVERQPSTDIYIYQNYSIQGAIMKILIEWSAIAAQWSAIADEGSI